MQRSNIIWVQLTLWNAPDNQSSLLRDGWTHAFWPRGAWVNCRLVAA